MIFSPRLSVTGVDLILRPRSRAARLSKAAAEAAAAGDSAAAESGWRKALALREAAGAGRDEAQRCDQHALAALLVQLGRPEEAEPFARGALEGPEADTLAARSERLAVMVDLLCDTGRAEEAEPLARALLAGQADDPDARGTRIPRPRPHLPRRSPHRTGAGGGGGGGSPAGDRRSRGLPRAGSPGPGGPDPVDRQPPPGDATTSPAPRPSAARPSTSSSDRSVATTPQSPEPSCASVFSSIAPGGPRRP